MAADPGAGERRWHLKEFKAEHLSFREWLQWSYGYTPEQLYELCLATGRYGDYNRVMEWYRRRYRWYNEQREQLRKACPFDINSD